MNDDLGSVEEPPTPGWVNDARWYWYQVQQNWKALAKLPVAISLILVAFLAYQFGKSQSVEEISVKAERIAFLNEQISAYKDRLQGATPDQAAKELSTLQGKLNSAEAKLQMLLPDNFRHLSAREIELLTIKADDLLGIGQVIPLFASSIGDSNTYMFDFISFFVEKKIPTIGPFAVTCDSKERGVLVGLKDVKQPSEKAKIFVATLKFAGLDPSNTRWAGFDRPGGGSSIVIPNVADFTLYICPP
jgi:hypothetical protein